MRSAKPGRKRKYPIHVLEVGEHVVIPFLEEKDGSLKKSQDPIYAAVRQESKRFGKQFEASSTYSGVYVKRVK
jgi:hypothetical protein